MSEDGAYDVVDRSASQPCSREIRVREESTRPEECQVAQISSGDERKGLILQGYLARDRGL